MDETGNAGSVRVLPGVIIVAFFELLHEPKTMARQPKSNKHFIERVEQGRVSTIIALNVLQH